MTPPRLKRHLHRETLLLKVQKCKGIAHSLSSEPVQLCLLPLIAQLLGLGQLPVTESREYHAPRSDPAVVNHKNGDCDCTLHDSLQTGRPPSGICIRALGILHASDKAAPVLWITGGGIEWGSCLRKQCQASLPRLHIALLLEASCSGLREIAPGAEVVKIERVA